EAPAERRRPAGAPLPSAPLIRRLAALGALDSFAGGFVLQSLVVYFLHERYALSLEALGYVVFATQVLTAASLLLAARFEAAQHVKQLAPRGQPRRLTLQHAPEDDAVTTQQRLHDGLDCVAV